MRQSKLFTKTRKEAPKDEVSKNAELLIRGGFIHKDMAGVYSFLPLGLRVLNKIEEIIREEMNAIGGQEVHLATLQDKSLWEKSGRWSDDVIDNWFKTKLKNGNEVGIGLTHEEPMTNLLRDHVRSFRDLPLYIYQFQTKFRNEARAKSGIMRSREFLMKDMYSFCRNKEEHDKFYEQTQLAYLRIYERIGLGDRTYTTFASGGIFSQYSHEFQTITDVGEDTIFIHEGKRIGINQEVLTDEVLSLLKIDRSELVEKKAVEVGNIFNLGSRYSDALGLNYKNENDEVTSILMGSYGIGLGRIMGTVAEVLSDERGLIWPESISPFKYHLIVLADPTGKSAQIADSLYESFNKGEVLYDERETGTGAKFADADLLGIPHRIVVGPKNAIDGNVEAYDRKTGKTEIVKIEQFL